jgi:hypothetical protein
MKVTVLEVTHCSGFLEKFCPSGFGELAMRRAADSF